MGRTSLNVAANFFGRVVGTVVSAAVIPLYLERMGREAFGLVGLFVSLQVIQTVLDVGLSLELSRRSARLLADPEANAAELGDVVKTFALVFTAIAACVLVACVLLAPLVATSWVRTETLTSADVEQAFVVIGAYLALQWPVSMLSGLLASAERQGIQNAISTTIVLCRAGLTLAVLSWVEASPRAFAGAQVIAALAHLAALVVVVGRLLPRSPRASRFRADILRASGAANLATMALTLLQIAISQTDRLVLSRTTELSHFGIYALAASLAANLHVFISPVYAAYFPRFCRSVEGAPEETSRLLLEGARAMAWVALPPSITLALFAHEALWAWTGDPEIAATAAPMLRALALGYGVAALHHVPQAVQYASGWLRPQIVVTALAALGGVAWFTLGGERLGLDQLAWGWFGMNTLILVGAAPLAVRQFAPQAGLRWAREGLVPVVMILAAVAIARVTLEGGDRTSSALVVVVGAVASLVGATAALTTSSAGRAMLAAGLAAGLARLRRGRR